MLGSQTEQGRAGVTVPRQQCPPCLARSGEAPPDEAGPVKSFGTGLTSSTQEISMKRSLAFGVLGALAVAVAIPGAASAQQMYEVATPTGYGFTTAPAYFSPGYAEPEARMSPYGPVMTRVVQRNPTLRQVIGPYRGPNPTGPGPFGLVTGPVYGGGYAPVVTGSVAPRHYRTRHVARYYRRY
jgi:hypothetical protein